jgi:hypothetical protein
MCSSCGCRTPISIFQPLCSVCYDTIHKARNRAYVAVRKAVAAGNLPNLKDTEVACADCSRRARFWEHRDYFAPLDVDPICGGCNTRRGPAVQYQFGSMQYIDLNELAA